MDVNVNISHFLIPSCLPPFFSILHVISVLTVNHLPPLLFTHLLLSLHLFSLPLLSLSNSHHPPSSLSSLHGFFLAGLIPAAHTRGFHDIINQQHKRVGGGAAVSKKFKSHMIDSKHGPAYFYFNKKKKTHIYMTQIRLCLKYISDESTSSVHFQQKWTDIIMLCFAVTK